MSKLSGGNRDVVLLSYLMYAARARTVLTAMLVERRSRNDESHAPTEPADSPNRSSSPTPVVDPAPATAPKRASRSPRQPTNPPPTHTVNRAGSSRDDMQVDHCPVRDVGLTKWRTVPFTIRGGLRVDVPLEQINAYDITDLQANVLTSN